MSSLELPTNNEAVIAVDDHIMNYGFNIATMTLDLKTYKAGQPIELGVSDVKKVRHLSNSTNYEYMCNSFVMLNTILSTL